MVEIIIKLPKELEFMQKVPSIYWTVAAQKILKSKLDETAEVIRIVGKSKMIEKDAEELTNEINELLAKRSKNYK